jgi:hypothetical protein
MRVERAFRWVGAIVNQTLARGEDVEKDQNFLMGFWGEAG